MAYIRQNQSLQTRVKEMYVIADKEILHNFLKTELLNLRNELITKCRHEKKFFLMILTGKKHREIKLQR